MISSSMQMIWENAAEEMVTKIVRIESLYTHFYTVTGVYLFSYFSLQNIECGYSLEPPKFYG